jgi:hypothetical protein
MYDKGEKGKGEKKKWKERKNTGKEEKGEGRFGDKNSILLDLTKVKIKYVREIVKVR